MINQNLRRFITRCLEIISNKEQSHLYKKIEAHQIKNRFRVRTIFRAD